ncbi:MAG: flavodoxin family protein [Deltaproteobacteria bacterium]|nr:flavodoxin family protein [Candidatus Zymogenaceae bacterium]
MTSPKRKIIGVCGSPRTGSNSGVMLEAMLEGAREAGVETELILLSDLEFSSCIGCEGCRRAKTCVGLDDDMTRLYPSLIDARGLALASPTHNYNITALMKTFIDRLYCFYDFTDDHPRAYSSRLAGRGRVAAAAAVCEQTDSSDMGFTIEAMTRPLSALGYEIAGDVRAYGVFEAGGIKKQPDVLEQCRELGRRTAQMIISGG